MMIYYKNILLNISNGLNSMRVSTAQNPYADKDAFILARAHFPNSPVTTKNGKQYYYFCDYSLDANALQYLLNRNGVLAYRRYSRYQVYCDERRLVVRVPVEYVASHPVADAFINKVIDIEAKGKRLIPEDMLKHAELVKKQMRQK